MSNDENAKESVESVNESEEVNNQAEEVVTETAAPASDNAANLVAKIMELKDSNPKVFFGGIAGLVVIILILMMSGGGNSSNLPPAPVVDLAIGQTYTLKGVNSYDPNATIRLVAVPGSMAAYDDTEEEDRNGDCKHMPRGTKVKLVQIQQAFGKAKFVEVEMLDGECAGRKGWVISNNLNK